MIRLIWRLNLLAWPFHRVQRLIITRPQLGWKVEGIDGRGEHTRLADYSGHSGNNVVRTIPISLT
jgi:hypothetical protein